MCVSLSYIYYRRPVHFSVYVYTYVGVPPGDGVVGHIGVEEADFSSDCHMLVPSTAAYDIIVVYFKVCTEYYIVTGRNVSRGRK